MEQENQRLPEQSRTGVRRTVFALVLLVLFFYLGFYVLMLTR